MQDIDGMWWCVVVDGGGLCWMVLCGDQRSRSKVRGKDQLVKVERSRSRPMSRLRLRSIIIF